MSKEVIDKMYILESNLKDVCKGIINAMNDGDYKLSDRLDKIREDYEKRIKELSTKH